MYWIIHSADVAHRFSDVCLYSVSILHSIIIRTCKIPATHARTHRLINSLSKKQKVKACWYQILLVECRAICNLPITHLLYHSREGLFLHDTTNTHINANMKAHTCCTYVARNTTCLSGLCVCHRAELSNDMLLWDHSTTAILTGCRLVCPEEEILPLPTHSEQYSPQCPDPFLHVNNSQTTSISNFKVSCY